ncbi:hypothetical protein ILYODFUR_028099 [Ilyodon furcidens]|uniref:Uncharacterized protein n=1 Tax=Ilyodon furcidens TaxID=33524 RepID=A0ABV0TZE9_9TELE
MKLGLYMLEPSCCQNLNTSAKTADEAAVGAETMAGGGADAWEDAAASSFANTFRCPGSPIWKSIKKRRKVIALIKCTSSIEQEWMKEHCKSGAFLHLTSFPLLLPSQ